MGFKITGGVSLRKGKGFDLEEVSLGLGPGPAPGGAGNMIGIRPSDDAYVNHTGANFNSQGGVPPELPYYEIQNTSDTIDFDVSEEVGNQDDPLLIIRTIWGSTQYELQDRDDGNKIIIDTISGFDSDVWMMELAGTTGQMRLTTFDDTQAAFFPFVEVVNIE